MKRALKWIGGILGALVLVAVLGFAWMVHSFNKALEPIESVSKYEEVLADWKASGLIDHFPSSVPANARNVKFSSCPAFQTRPRRSSPLLISRPRWRIYSTIFSPFSVPRLRLQGRYRLNLQLTLRNLRIVPAESTLRGSLLTLSSGRAKLPSAARPQHPNVFVQQLTKILIRTRNGHLKPFLRHRPRR